MDLFPELVRRMTGFDVTPEHRFHDTRKWRIDYAIIPEKIAIEVEGGAYTNGRHTRQASGYMHSGIIQRSINAKINQLKTNHYVNKRSFPKL